MKAICWAQCKLIIRRPNAETLLHLRAGSVVVATGVYRNTVSFCQQ